MKVSAPDGEKVFVPHAECSVPSGECFGAGRCLDTCRARRKREHEARLKELERKVVELQLIVFKAKARGIL